VALQCVATLPKEDRLDADDEDALTKLEIIRHTAMTFRQSEPESPGNSSLDTSKREKKSDATRMGFGQKVAQLCQKHSNIVLAPLFPDLTSGTTTLYGCKNIIAPEK
jgi:hypothetical protein